MRASPITVYGHITLDSTPIPQEWDISGSRVEHYERLTWTAEWEQAL